MIWLEIILWISWIVVMFLVLLWLALIIVAIAGILKLLEKK